MIIQNKYNGFEGVFALKNKTIKWTVISISTASLLTFGGLVTKNQSETYEQNVVDNQNGITDNDNQNNNWQRNGENDEEDKQWGEFDEDESTFGDRSESNWGQDQFQQIPSQGFNQGQGSSGTSKW